MVAHGRTSSSSMFPIRVSTTVTFLLLTLVSSLPEDQTTTVSTTNSIPCISECVTCPVICSPPPPPPVHHHTETPPISYYYPAYPPPPLLTDLPPPPPVRSTHRPPPVPLSTHRPPPPPRQLEQAPPPPPFKYTNPPYSGQAPPNPVASPDYAYPYYYFYASGAAEKASQLLYRIFFVSIGFIICRIVY